MKKTLLLLCVIFTFASCSSSKVFENGYASNVGKNRSPNSFVPCSRVSFLAKR